jgi:hypothetical protein
MTWDERYGGISKASKPTGYGPDRSEVFGEESRNREACRLRQEEDARRKEYQAYKTESNMKNSIAENTINNLQLNLKLLSAFNSEYKLATSELICSNWNSIWHKNCPELHMFSFKIVIDEAKSWVTMDYMQNGNNPETRLQNIQYLANIVIYTGTYYRDMEMYISNKKYSLSAALDLCSSLNHEFVKSNFTKIRDNPWLKEKEAS